MENIENIYSLSPLQQGLLFHSVYEPSSRVYQQQLSLRIEGNLDRQAFVAAWQYTIKRHTALRTAILWEDLDDAYQVVLSDLPLPLTELDWRGRVDHDNALLELEFAERNAPLDLVTPPLMRLCLVRLDEQRWHLLWTHHHIVLDGWSEGIVLRDWLACYHALRLKQTPQLPPTRPFQDYIAWLAEQDVAAAEVYWRSRLGAIAEPTPLPSFSRQLSVLSELPHSTLTCAEQSLTLSAEESQRLVEFAKAQQVTLNTVIQAAWGWLLGTHAGTQNALFGVTVGGRADTLAYADEMVGLFINTLPLLVEWEQDIAVGDWLRQLQAQVADMRQYEYSALHRLKAFSAIPADRPLFEAILVFENFPLDESLSESALADEAAELRFRGRECAVHLDDVLLTQGRNNFPLSLIAIPSGEAFEFALSYARARFADVQIRYLLRQFRTLLTNLTRDAKASVHTLNAVSTEDRAQLLAWGEGLRKTVPQLCIHQLFEQHAERFPQQAALVTSNVSLSYSELNARANQFARLLLSQGVTTGEYVAIGLERNADFIIALLAVLKVGAAYLPLDLKQPSARLAELLADSGATVVVTHSTWRRLFPSTLRLLEMDQLQTTYASQSDLPLTIDVTPDTPAYLIYTSGSTGTPKGVVVQHHALVDYLESAFAVLTPPVGSRYGLLSTIAADLGHTQLFGALCRGGTLVVADEDTSFNPLALADFFASNHIDVLKISPSHLRGLLNAHNSAALLPRHTLVFGGDALDSPLLQQVRALSPQVRIFNHYGPTEATVGAVAGEICAKTSPTAVIPLGKTLPNRRLYVLDAQGRPAPIGAPGELFIGGNLAQGYLKRPQLTHERFVPNTLAADDTRLYRTGDRVRWLTDGTLAFLGRIDSQVKIRGNRIELGEVEAQVKRLSSHIQQVIARVVQAEGQAPRLVAYIVANESLSVAKLRDDLSIRVPEYMMPAHFITLDAIPLTANGKPDHRRLPLPPDQAATRTAYTAPRNEIEQTLATIWQDVLKTERIGIHDNFFALGGDSILNLQIIARANQQGMRLTPKQLFENRTIADIAAVLRGQTATNASTQEKGQVLPLSAGQRARLEAGPLATTWRCVILDKSVNSTTLGHALNALQQHHRALQLALEFLPAKAASASNTPVSSSLHWHQHVPARPKSLSVSEHTVSRQDKAALFRLADTCLQQLDFAAGETLHACLLRDPAIKNEQAVLLIAHPLVLDEASWPLILHDLELALAQLNGQRTLRLAHHGGDFAAWNKHQQSYSESDAIDTAWEYWLQFAGIEVPRLAIAPLADTQFADSPLADTLGKPDASAADASYASFSQTVSLDAAVSTRLQGLCNATQLRWTTLLAAVLAEQIHAYHPADDASPIVLAIEGGRPTAECLSPLAPLVSGGFDPSRMVGPLSLNVPVFLPWPGNDDPLQYLHAIDAHIHAQPQYGADYGVLQYLSTNTYMQEALASLPKPQILLRFLGDWDAHQEPNGLLNTVVASSISMQAEGNSEQQALVLDAYWQHGRLHLQSRGPLSASWTTALQQKLEQLATWSTSAQLRPASHTFPLCQPQAKSLVEQSLDWNNIESIYPLTPMQQGMLLHTLLQPHSGVYLMQQHYTWEGSLDRNALQIAWHQLLQRHPLLRTAFWWQDEHAPLQCVYRHVEGAFEWYDWRHLDASIQQRELGNKLAEELRQGYDMQRAPLTFLRVFHLQDGRYSLVRSFHHILTDAWCFGLIMEDLLALYEAELHHSPLGRPLLPPFRDYLGWLARQDMQAAETFWRAELAGLTEPTPLVVDTPSATPERAPDDINNVDVTLSVALTQQLQALCQQHQLTPNTWLQGAWALLLSRYSGHNDVMFAVTVAGRPADLRGVEDMVGLFINSLPLRVKIDAQQPVIGWLQTLLGRNVELRAFEHAPLVEIQRWSEIPRGRPLFESLVVFENATTEVDVGSLRQREFAFDMHEDRVHTNFPMTVVLYPGDRLGMRLSYDPQRFTLDSAERMLGHLTQLLTDMLARPEAPLHALEMLTPQERHLLLDRWNQTDTKFPLERSYAALLAAKAKVHPERIAAMCEGESLTYAELDRLTDSVAQTLMQAGAKSDTVVALAAERGLTLLTMMIGTLKAGAAFLSLDINHPPQRLCELLNLSQAPIVLVSHRTAALLDQWLPELKVRPTCLVAENAWQSQSSSSLLVDSAPSDLAYVIFTSGSTGVPKGVMIEQRSMLNNIFGKVPALGLGEHDRIAQTASPAFDISIWQFLAAPLLGGTVHILPDAVAHEPARLLEAMEREQLTIVEAVPAVIQGLLQESTPMHHLSQLRWVLPTGEALPPGLSREWCQRYPHVPMMNAYGPAECADDVAFYPIHSAPAEGCLHMPIGRPTANNRLFIIDENLRPVPIGVPGEICVAGIGVGRGYLRDPERTQQAFIRHPFAADQRAYRTGDVGRFRADGVIEYLGRRDQQVKIRGHRIELGEIESRLSLHDALQSAAVVAVADARGTQHLLAYFAIKPDLSGENADAFADSLKPRLVSHLKQQLPSYMVPTHWVRLDRFPVNANGKIDRRALVTRGLPVSQCETSVTKAPRTVTEQRLADIWKTLLNLTEISVEDNFFSLGGHSLLATQMASRIRKTFRITLPLRALFDHASIAELALYIDNLQLKHQQIDQQQEATALPTMTVQRRDSRLPLSFAQQRLWFIDQRHPGQQWFTLPFLLTLTGELSVNALQKSFTFLLERHEVLRTAIISEEGEPWQQIIPSQNFELPEEQLSATVTESQASILDYVQQFFRQGFDLRKPPLLRAKLFQINPHQHLLAIAMHHIAVDDWSLGIFVHDLLTTYNAFRDHQQPALPPLGKQYADFSVWQRQLPEAFWQGQLHYWQQQLAGSVPVLHLPHRREDADSSSSFIGRYECTLPQALTTALHAQAEAHGCTPFMVLYAAFNIVISEQTGRNDLLMGTDVANRHHFETEDMMGFFINQLVLRCRVNPQLSFDQLLAECRTTLLESYQHQDLPFDNLVAQLLPHRDHRYTPFFQIKIIYQNAPQRDLTLNGLEIDEWVLPPGNAEFDLLVNCIPEPDGLRISYDYNANLYSGAYINTLATLFTTLLETVISRTDASVAQLISDLQHHQKNLLQANESALKAQRQQQRTTLNSVRRKAVTTLEHSN